MELMEATPEWAVEEEVVAALTPPRVSKSCQNKLRQDQETNRTAPKMAPTTLRTYNRKPSKNRKCRLR